MQRCVYVRNDTLYTLVCFGARITSSAALLRHIVTIINNLSCCQFTVGFITSGLYFFEYTHSGVPGGVVGAVITHNGNVRSAEALVNGGGAMSTHALFVCAPGDRVYVTVSTYMPQNNNPVQSRNGGNSLFGFSGYLINALE